MLNGKEKYVMKYLYTKCTGQKSNLVSPRDVITYVSDKFVMYPSELDVIMTNLCYDNYIDLVRSDKKGEPIFCISLKLKGEGFIRELKNNKRNWYFLITRTLMLAMLSFLFGLLLNWFW